MKTNCWEYKKCGRESNGAKGGKINVCPASTERILDGVHGGVNAGRSCWVVAGTMCDGKVQGTFAQKVKDCLRCDFYALVINEERDNVLRVRSLLEKINKGIIT